MPAWTFEVGHRSSVTPRAASSRHSVRVVDRARAVGDPLRVDGERPADLGGAAPLAGVQRDAETARARGRERALVRERIRERLLGPREVEPDEAVRPEPRGGLGERDVVGRVVRAEGGRDEPGHDAVPLGGRARPADHGRDPVDEREAARDVEQRAPADLDVADAVGRLRLDQLVRRSARAPRRPASARSAGRTARAARPGRGSARGRSARADIPSQVARRVDAT